MTPRLQHLLTRITLAYHKMGLAVGVKHLMLLQISIVLLCSFAVSDPIFPRDSPPHYHAVSPVMPPSPPPGNHKHHHPHPPTQTPKTPTPAPVPKSPIHPPTAKPPTYPPTMPPTTKPPTSTPSPKPPATKPPTNPSPKPPATKPPTYPAPKPPIKPPTQPPTKPPTKAPTYPPSPPVKPPTYPKPTSSRVAVQGVVYCKSCQYAGIDTLLGAKPVDGATVNLACKDAKNDLTVQFVTDKNGYFFLQAPITINNFSLSDCSVSLVSSPMKSCITPSNMNGGLEGAPLKPDNSSTSKKLPYVLYSVGPFAFEPKCH